MIRKHGCQKICDARENLAMDTGGNLLVCFMVCMKQKRPEMGAFIEALAERESAKGLCHSIPCALNILYISTLLDD
jgi:hypothetical protein